MIIFGWGFQTIKKFGPVFKNLCAHCNNEQYWLMSRIMTWFTLFFIPVFPYKIEHRLSCPVCKYGITLTQKQIDEFRPIAEANQLLVDGKISQEQYQALLNLPNSIISEPVKDEIEIKDTTSQESKLSYCASCGKEMTKELRFCGNCGSASAIK